MALPKLTKLELQIMETLWTQGACSVREIHQAFPERGRPAFTTVQTTIYRLESKKALRRTKRISNANIFEAVISRDAAQSRLVDDLLNLFGGRTKPVMAHLIRIRQAHVGRRQRSRAGNPSTRKKGQEAMSLGRPLATGEPPVAIDALRRRGLALGVLVEKQSRPGPILRSGWPRR